MKSILKIWLVSLVLQTVDTQTGKCEGTTCKYYDLIAADYATPDCYNQCTFYKQKAPCDASICMGTLGTKWCLDGYCTDGISKAIQCSNCVNNNQCDITNTTLNCSTQCIDIPPAQNILTQVDYNGDQPVTEIGTTYTATTLQVNSQIAQAGVDLGFNNSLSTCSIFFDYLQCYFSIDAWDQVFLLPATTQQANKNFTLLPAGANAKGYLANHKEISLEMGTQAEYPYTIASVTCEAISSYFKFQQKFYLNFAITKQKMNFTSFASIVSPGLLWNYDGSGNSTDYDNVTVLQDLIFDTPLGVPYDQSTNEQNPACSVLGFYLFDASGCKLERNDSIGNCSGTVPDRSTSLKFSPPYEVDRTLYKICYKVHIFINKVNQFPLTGFMLKAYQPWPSSTGSNRAQKVFHPHYFYMENTYQNCDVDLKTKQIGVQHKLLPFDPFIGPWVGNFYTDWFNDTSKNASGLMYACYPYQNTSFEHLVYDGSGPINLLGFTGIPTGLGYSNWNQWDPNLGKINVTFLQNQVNYVKVRITTVRSSQFNSLPFWLTVTDKPYCSSANLQYTWTNTSQMEVLTNQTQYLGANLSNWFNFQLKLTNPSCFDFLILNSSESSLDFSSNMTAGDFGVEQIDLQNSGSMTYLENPMNQIYNFRVYTKTPILGANFTSAFTFNIKAKVSETLMTIPMQLVRQYCRHWLSATNVFYSKAYNPVWEQGDETYQFKIEGIFWDPDCPPTFNYIVQEHPSPDAPNTMDFAKAITYPSQTKCVDISNATCDTFDFRPYIIGEIFLEVIPITIPFWANLTQSLKVRLTSSCFSYGSPKYKMLYTSGAMGKTNIILKYQDPVANLTIDGFAINWPLCSQIIKFVLVDADTNQTTNSTMTNLSRIVFSCDPNPPFLDVFAPENCTKLMITSNLIGTQRFYIKAVADKGFEGLSELFTVTIKEKENAYYPYLLPPPPNITMYQNETRLIQLPEIKDADLNPVAPLFFHDLEYLQDQLMPQLFVKFNKTARTIFIDPKDNMMFVGKYPVKLTVDDSRGFLTTYSFNLEVKTTRVYVLPSATAQQTEKNNGLTSLNQSNGAKSAFNQTSMTIFDVIVDQIIGNSPGSSAKRLVYKTKLQQLNALLGSSSDGSTIADLMQKLKDKQMLTKTMIDLLLQNLQQALLAEGSVNGTYKTGSAVDIILHRINLTNWFDGLNPFNVTNRRLVDYEMMEPTQQGEVTIRFYSEIDWTKTKKEILNVTGYLFRVIQNEEFKQEQIETTGTFKERNTNITKAYVVKTGWNFITYQLKFADINAISKGGVKLKDLLFYNIYAPYTITFKKQQTYNAYTGSYDEFRPVLNIYQNGTVERVPLQLDTLKTINRAIIQVSDVMNSGLNTFMILQFILQLFISVSTKQLINAIKVLQLITFYIFLLVNYTPASLYFLDSLYKFATFKVMPPELLDWILYQLNLLYSDQPALDPDLERIHGKSKGRRLEFGEVKKTPEFLKSMNMIIIMAVAFGVILVIGLVMLSVVSYYEKLRVWLKRKLMIIFYNSIHSFVNHAALPVIFNSLKKIKYAVQNDQRVSCIPQLLICVFFVIYPFVMRTYLVIKQRKFNRGEIFFDKAHGSAFLTNAKRITFIYVIHFRKFIYISIIVFSETYPIIQIIMIITISQLMIMLINQLKPFQTKIITMQENLAEVVMILSSYHLFMLSDWVPIENENFREGVGFSLVAVILLVTLAYVFLMLLPVALKIFSFLKKVHQSRQYNKRKLERIQVGALAMLIQIDHLRQVIEMNEKEKDKCKNTEEAKEKLVQFKARQAQINKLQRQIHMNEAKIKILQQSQFQNELSWEKQIEIYTQINNDVVKFVYNSPSLIKENEPRAAEMHQILKSANITNVLALLLKEAPHLEKKIVVEQRFRNLRTKKKKELNPLAVKPVDFHNFTFGEGEIFDFGEAKTNKKTPSNDRSLYDVDQDMFEQYLYVAAIVDDSPWDEDYVPTHKEAFYIDQVQKTINNERKINKLLDKIRLQEKEKIKQKEKEMREKDEEQLQDKYHEKFIQKLGLIKIMFGLIFKTNDVNKTAHLTKSQKQMLEAKKYEKDMQNYAKPSRLDILKVDKSPRITDIRKVSHQLTSVEAISDDILPNPFTTPVDQDKITKINKC